MVGQAGTGRAAPAAYLPRPGPRAHSLILSFRWRDQGWGNRKGYVLVFSGENPPEEELVDYSPMFPFGSRAYTGFGEAPHSFKKKTMIWNANNADVADVVYVSAGGGGGHEILISDAVVSEARLEYL